MPKAELGSTKHLSNQLKSKGLQRLRWYCQPCEKQCRDANGFKMHTQSESHVRQMLLVGEDPKKFTNQYSNEFLKDFIQLLKTGHGEKPVQINRFYQEYIANKEHIHMNSTKWPSLTEFAKHLGREGICRVEETDKGLHISWIDDSPEALRRKEALKRKEAQDQGDEELEQRMIRDQIRRAQAASGAARKEDGTEEDDKSRELRREGDQKIALSFGPKKTESRDATDTTTTSQPAEAGTSDVKESADAATAPAKPAGFGGISMKLGGKPQTKNVFSSKKKSGNVFGGKKTGGFVEQPKKMSEAERIMKEEMDRKRSREEGGFGIPSAKRQKPPTGS